jgi:hypothetical protein
MIVMVCEMAVMYLLAKDILSSRVGKRIALLLKSSFASAVDKGIEAINEAKEDAKANVYTRLGE